MRENTCAFDRFALWPGQDKKKKTNLGRFIVFPAVCNFWGVGTLKPTASCYGNKREPLATRVLRLALPFNSFYCGEGGGGGGVGRGGTFIAFARCKNNRTNERHVVF